MQKYCLVLFCPVRAESHCSNGPGWPLCHTACDDRNYSKQMGRTEKNVIDYYKQCQRESYLFGILCSISVGIYKSCYNLCFTKLTNFDYTLHCTVLNHGHWTPNMSIAPVGLNQFMLSEHLWFVPLQRMIPQCCELITNQIDSLTNAKRHETWMVLELYFNVLVKKSFPANAKLIVFNLS